MKDLCRSREGATLARRARGRERSPFSCRRGRSAWRWVYIEARGRRSLPAAIRLYHTHLDSEDGVDGLFDAREVSLAEGPQHLILADADQGLPRGPNDDDVAAAASSAAAAAAVLRRVGTRHVTRDNTRRVAIGENSATSLRHPRGFSISRARKHDTHAALLLREPGPRETVRNDARLA